MRIPEQNLCAALLLCALSDTFGKARSRVSQAERRTAIQWFNGEHSLVTCQTVCDALDLDYKLVKKTVLHHVVRGTVIDFNKPGEQLSFLSEANHEIQS